MIKTSTPDAGCNYATVEPGSQQVRLSALGREQIWPLFEQSGAILLRGFTLDVREFDDFTAKFCSRFVSNSSPGRQSISADSRTQTVNLGPEPFPLHAELSREPFKPDIAFFACARAPRSRGETLLCDGTAIVAGLQASTRKLLQENLLEHRVVVSPEECLKIFGREQPRAADLDRVNRDSDYEFSIKGDKCFRMFTTPALQEPKFSAGPAFANFLLFARYYLNLLNFPTFAGQVIIPNEVCAEIKAVSDSLSVAHRWQKHDLLMVDNTRFMHGRNAVENPAERLILTQFGYV